LLADLNRLTMVQACFARGMTDTAVLVLLMRKLESGFSVRGRSPAARATAPMRVAQLV